MRELADAAFLAASQDVIDLAIRTGTQVIIWKDNAVQAVDPHTIQLPRPRKKKKPGKDRSPSDQNNPA